LTRHAVNTDWRGLSIAPFALQRSEQVPAFCADAGAMMLVAVSVKLPAAPCCYAAKHQVMTGLSHIIH
jgi:hypothetical protein